MEVETRRGFLKVSGIGVFAVVLGSCGSDDNSSSGSTSIPSAQAPQTASPVDDVADVAIAHFAALGFDNLSPAPLITGDAFNGGLRYDATPDSASEHGLRVQPSARVEDVESDDPTTLALFHQLHVQGAAADHSNEGALGIAIDLIATSLGLDPTRLGVVSTELMAPLAPVVATFGVADGNIVLRDLDEALTARDGSGYFDPEGHPQRPERLTLSLHYQLDPETAELLTYPTGPGWIELAEMSLNAGTQTDAPTVEWAFGIERLQLARDGATTTVDDARNALLAALDAEIEGGAKRPPAYELVENASS